MFTTTNNTSFHNLDELNRQKKQAEMIRQYLQVTNIDTTNLLPIKTPISESESTVLPLSSFNFDELRQDLKMAEERVERLREELKEIHRKRDDSYTRTPPPSYVSPSIHPSNSDISNHRRSTSANRGVLERTTPPPLVQELLPSQQQQQTQRQLVNNTISSPILLPNFNAINHLPSVPVDTSKDHRQRQFFSTMHQHREQLVVHLDSLKQALNSLEHLATLEPTRSEVHLANMKLDTIQQKSRQLRALKSNRSSQQSPFIECRIRQLEHDLVYMLGEHQKDVQAKLELNEQRSLMLLKIMQVADELTSLDQQIQQLSYNNNNTDMHRINSSPLSNEIHQQQMLRVIHPTNHFDDRHVSFRDLITDNNPLTNVYYQHHHHH